MRALGFLLVALLLQGALLNLSVFANYHPDIVFLALVYIALTNGSIYGVYCGFLAGLLQDVYSVETLGAGAFAKSLTGYCLGWFDERRFKGTIISRSALLVVGLLIHDFLYSLLIGLGFLGALAELWRSTIPTVFLTLPLGMMFFWWRRTVPES